MDYGLNAICCMEAESKRYTAARNDRIIAAVTWAAALAIAAVFAWLLADLVRHGASRLSWQFLVQVPRHAGRAGGIGPILLSTAMIIGVCLVVSIPIGVGTAILLAEYTTDRQPFGRRVRRSLDILAGVPSIVFGLFGNALFCRAFGMGFSILSGGLTLACMVLPILIRATEEGLRAVPNESRLSASALGLSRLTTLRTLLLPAAAPGLAAGLVLGIGRAMAETAALIFTSGYVDRWPSSLADSGRALSVHIFDLSMNVPGGDANAYASALVLVASLLVINGLASWLLEAVLTRKVAR